MKTLRFILIISSFAVVSSVHISSQEILKASDIKPQLNNQPDIKPQLNNQPDIKPQLNNQPSVPPPLNVQPSTPPPLSNQHVNSIQSGSTIKSQPLVHHLNSDHQDFKFEKNHESSQNLDEKILEKLHNQYHKHWNHQKHFDYHYKSSKSKHQSLYPDNLYYCIQDENGKILFNQVNSFSVARQNQYECNEKGIEILAEYSTDTNGQVFSEFLYLIEGSGCGVRSDQEYLDSCPRVKKYEINEKQRLMILDSNVQLVFKDQTDKLIANHLYRTYSFIAWLLFKFQYYDIETDTPYVNMLYKDFCCLATSLYLGLWSVLLGYKYLYIQYLKKSKIRFENHIEAIQQSVQPNYVPAQQASNQPNYVPAQQASNQPNFIPAQQASNQPNFIPAQQASNQPNYVPAQQASNQTACQPVQSQPYINQSVETNQMRLRKNNNSRIDQNDGN